MAAIGPAKVATRSPKEFLKKKEKTAPLEKTNNRPSRNVGEGGRKPSVPKVDEKPVMGIVTQKNFVKTNKVDAAQTAPVRLYEEEDNFLEKEDYGKAPAYLDKVKDAIKKEGTAAKEARERELQGDKPRMRALTREEKDEMLVGLRENLGRLELSHRQLPLGTLVLSQKQRKEDLEKQMGVIEKDIELLSSEKELLVTLED